MLLVRGGVLAAWMEAEALRSWGVEGLSAGLLRRAARGEQCAVQPLLAALEREQRELAASRDQAARAAAELADAPG